MRNVIALLALAGLSGPHGVAAPPPPPEGYKWVVNEKFSDEFNGTSLDTNNWHDHHPRWKGRPPAKFVPAALAVTNGCLRTQAGQLSEPDGQFTLAGGAVVSRSEEAFTGIAKSA